MEIKEIKTIGEVSLNNTNRSIKVILKDVGGVNYVDVRKYFVNKEGKEQATNKGVMMSEEVWLKILPILEDYLAKEKEIEYYE